MTDIYHLPDMAGAASAPIWYGYARSRAMGHLLANPEDSEALCGRAIRDRLSAEPRQVCQWCRWAVNPIGRVMASVRIPDDRTQCWLWLGGVARSNGYGRAWLNGETTAAHIVVYRLLVGDIPPGREIDHKCHNIDLDCPGGLCAHRRCVNPAHLEAVTPSVNQVRQGARKTRCPKGHEYTKENTAYRKGTNCRSCRTCNRARALKNARARRARLSGVSE